MKLAVFFPGIGYTVDKPLMYYGRRIAANHGYEIKLLPYAGFPGKVIGDRDIMEESFRIAWCQSKEMLSDTDFSNYGEILLVGKSIGTIVAARMAEKSSVREKTRLILYTPLEKTFDYSFENAVAFTGLADPWVGKKDSRIPMLCKQREIECHLIKGANHSLETGDVRKDLRNMQMIMTETEKFVAGV